MILTAKKYFLSLISLLCTLFCAGLLILGDNYFNWFSVIPCFYSLLGIIFYFSIKFLTTKPENTFITYYLAILFSKFFIAIVFISLYLFFVKEQKTIFIIGFLIYYVIFSIFETRIFLKIAKKTISEK